MNDWHQTLSSGTLLLIAAAAIALILLMIMRWRVHALLTLTVVSLLTALATGIPAQAIVNGCVVEKFWRHARRRGDFGEFGCDARAAGGNIGRRAIAC